LLERLAASLPSLSSATFLPQVLALPWPSFFGLAFAARFTGRFREDLEGLRALPRAIDFALRFRTAGRFFR
jgi:hypothetical protein